MDTIKRVSAFFIEADKINLTILILLTLIADTIRTSIYNDIGISNTFTRILITIVLNVLLFAFNKLL